MCETKPDEDTDQESKESLEVKNTDKKFWKTPKTRPEYLRPFIEAREKRESEKGKYQIDLRDIKERAKMMKYVKDKGSSYFTHMIGHG